MKRLESRAWRIVDLMRRAPGNYVTVEDVLKLWDEAGAQRPKTMCGISSAISDVRKMRDVRDIESIVSLQGVQGRPRIIGYRLIENRRRA